MLIKTLKQGDLLTVCIKLDIKFGVGKEFDSAKEWSSQGLQIVPFKVEPAKVNSNEYAWPFQGTWVFLGGCVI